jgi:hypothetical protein
VEIAKFGAPLEELMPEGFIEQGKSYRQLRECL